MAESAIVQSGNIINAGRDVINNWTVISPDHGSISKDAIAHEIDDSERQKVVDWLLDIATVNHYAIQSETYAKVTPGTASWVLKEPEFDAWLSGQLGTLWGVGIPGAGKTVLTSFVIHHLEKCFSDQETREITLFAYSRFNDSLSVTKILAALLGQLVDASLPARSYIYKDLYLPCQKKKISPTEDELSNHLHTAVTRASTRIFIIIDALDELRDETREKLVELLLALKQSIFLTSRELSLTCLSSPNIRVRAPSEDFSTFITAEVKRLPKLWSLLKDRKDVHEEIIKEVMSKSDGMFLLAALQLSALGGITNIRSLRKAIDTLPTKLFDMYRFNLKRIMDQHAEEHTLACRALLWVANAGRPIKDTELLEALAVEPESTELDPDARTSEMTLISICCGLLTIEKETHTVRLIHYTTYDFFLAQKLGPFQHPHIFAATICAVYFQLSGFGSHKVTELEDSEEAYPFIQYACRYIGYHTCKSIQESDGNLHPLLDNIFSENLYIPLLPVNGFPRPCIKEIHYGSITHFGALHGLPSVLKASKQNVNQMSRDEYSPLFYASLNGHDAIVDWLLGGEDIDVNQSNKDGYTALHVASEHGHDKVVQLLLASPGIDIHATNDYLYTALHKAANGCHTRVVKLLLDFPWIDINAQNILEKTALYMASELGHAPVVRLLLGFPGIDANIPNHEGHTALYKASQEGHREVVRLLANAPGINLNGHDANGNTALHMAALHHHEHVLKVLLSSTTTDVNAQNRRGNTALHIAAKYGAPLIVQMLIQSPGIKVDIQNKTGETPLSAAKFSELGREDSEVVKLLQDAASVTSRHTDYDDLIDTYYTNLRNSRSVT